MATTIDRYMLSYLILFIFVFSGGIIQVVGAFFDVPKWLLQPLMLSGAGELYFVIGVLVPVLVPKMILLYFLGFSVLKFSSMYAGKSWRQFLVR